MAWIPGTATAAMAAQARGMSRHIPDAGETGRKARKNKNGGQTP